MNKLERLRREKVIITSEKGNSMLPLIKSGQKHELTLVEGNLSILKINDIVYCKVRGRYYTHKIFAIDSKKGYKIGNNKGRINGWTKNIFGLVTKIL